MQLSESSVQEAFWIGCVNVTVFNPLPGGGRYVCPGGGGGGGGGSALQKFIVIYSIELCSI